MYILLLYFYWTLSHFTLDTMRYLIPLCYSLFIFTVYCTVHCLFILYRHIYIYIQYIHIYIFAANIHFKQLWNFLSL